MHSCNQDSSEVESNYLQVSQLSTDLLARLVCATTMSQETLKKKPPARVYLCGGCGPSEMTWNMVLILARTSARSHLSICCTTIC